MAVENNQLEYICLKPDDALADVVESIWMVKNHSDAETEGVVIPDGKIDLFFFGGKDGSFEIFFSGICSVPIIKPPFPKSVMFAISFYPVAAEYIFKQSFAQLHNAKKTLPQGYWGFCKNDLTDFGTFYQKGCNIMLAQYTREVEMRKKNLFSLVYASKGEITVKELAEKVNWSSRQINRYFRTWLGVTLKNYLNTIRFSNSLEQLKNGDMYPELNYGDQSHFIREVKKFSGVKPSVLVKNENDRFIQFSLMRKD